MANTFAGAPLYDPRLARAHRVRFNRDVIDKLRLANSFYSSSGRWPGRGWVLLRRKDYDTVNPYSTSLSLVINDGKNGALTLQGLTVVQARCVTRGRSADPDALYLLEITDRKGVLENRWFCFPTNSQYNVRSPAYPGQFYRASIQGGTTPWTWSLMAGDIWNQMSTFIGAYPGLPTVPSGTPENWIFPGCGCWEALDRVIDQLGLVIVNDLTKTPGTGYSIVTPGAADATFTTLQSTYANVLEDDLEWIDTGSGRVPASIVVYFHRANTYYGTEETIRRDSLQWQSTPLYAITVAAPAMYVNATGTAYLWDDFVVHYDVDNNPDPADVATANVIAADRVTSFFNKITRSTEGFMSRTYAGALPFQTSSQVDGVCWRQDYRDDTRLAWRTEIVRGHLWDMITEDRGWY